MVETREGRRVGKFEYKQARVSEMGSYEDVRIGNMRIYVYECIYFYGVRELSVI